MVEKTEEKLVSNPHPFLSSEWWDFSNARMRERQEADRIKKQKHDEEIRRLVEADAVSKIYQGRECPHCMHQWRQTGYRNPIQCPRCRKSLSVTPREKYDWSSMEVGEERFYPWYLDAAGNLDDKRNNRRLRDLQRYRSAHKDKIIHMYPTPKGIEVVRKK